MEFVEMADAGEKKSSLPLKDYLKMASDEYKHIKVQVIDIKKNKPSLWKKMKLGMITVLVAVGFAAVEPHLDYDKYPNPTPQYGQVQPSGIFNEVPAANGAVKEFAELNAEKLNSLGLDVEKTNNVVDKANKFIEKHKITPPELMSSSYLSCVRKAMDIYLQYKQAIEQPPPPNAEAKNKAEEYLRILADALAEC